jgi:hypothetical protein
VRDEPLGNALHARGLCRIAIEGTLVGRDLRHLQVLLACGSGNLRSARREHRHLLRPVDTHHPAAGGLHGLAAGHHEGHADGPS